VALVTGAIAVEQMRIGRDINWAAFLDQMERKGFIEGRTVIYERYLMPEAMSATSAAAQENARVALSGAPDAIFWGGAPTTTLAAVAINKNTPMVVMTGDLLAQGVVTNQSQPGGNVTGVSVTGSPETEGKMLALLSEVVPRARTFAYLNAGSGTQFTAIKQAYAASVGDAAARLGLTMVPVAYTPGGGEAVFAEAFDRMAAKRVEMVVFGTDTAVSATAQQQLVAKLALNARLPSVAPWGGFADAGGLLSYGGNLPDLARRSADYVAMILAGAKPGDLPVLAPTVFDLVVNLKTAKAIGANIPEFVILQATKVIE
jgi:putative ABC transport system substrate-binding protein